jgi:hypothetical protein
MARCPHCNEVISDKWIRKNGASLMGKAGGRAKARNNASAAAKARWARAREKAKK